MIRKNSLKAWILASRPYSFPASATPVVVASALAFHDGKFQWLPALICLVFAILAQVIANFTNDYYDFVNGSDDGGLHGPTRAAVEGWVDPRAMLYAALGLCVLNSVIGSSLMYYGGWQVVPVGIAVVIFALAYTGGPYPLAYHGWGDVCVFVFFGIVPVGMTYFLQAGSWPMSATICGIAVGLVVVNILVANNYRDRSSDAQANKKTTIVLFGERFGRYFYLVNGLIAVLCCQYFLLQKYWFAAILPMFYLILLFVIYARMNPHAVEGELNTLPEQSAKNVMVFCAALSLGLILPY